MTALAILRRADILSQLAAGRLVRDVAADLGVTPAAISQCLSGDPEYKAAKEIGMELQLDQWQSNMAEAEDALNLSRAREVFRAVSWRAEREHPHRWGQVKDAGKAGPAVAIQINLRRDVAGQQEVKVVTNQGEVSADSAIISEGKALDH